MPRKKILARVNVGDFEILVKNIDEYNKILQVLKIPIQNIHQEQKTQEQKPEFKKLEV